jgi:hypothetical protein
MARTGPAAPAQAKFARHKELSGNKKGRVTAEPAKKPTNKTLLDER